MISEVSRGAAISLLKTRTRRRVVTLLLEIERTWDIRELADELVRLDPTMPPERAATGRQTDRVAIRLYHCALPRLADAGVVDFDCEEQTVAPGPHLPALGAHFDALFVNADADYEAPGLTARA